jgi:membrane fusion protein, copper/silver efflux system
VTCSAPESRNSLDTSFTSGKIFATKLWSSDEFAAEHVRLATNVRLSGCTATCPTQSNRGCSCETPHVMSSGRRAVGYASLFVIGVVGILLAVNNFPPVLESSAVNTPTETREPPDRASIVLDDRRQQLAGIRTEAVVRGTLARTAHGLGSVIFDESRITDVNLRLGGWIRDLHVNYTGQRVRQGEPLLTLFSQELIGAQLQYLAAWRSREQLTPAQSADREYQERLIETPRRRLLYWDVPEDQLRALERAGEAIEAVTFRSPADGVVIEKVATRGMHVEAGQTLFKLAGTSVVWIDAAFSPSDAAHMRAGKPAEIVVAGQATEKITGKILYIYPSLAESSRTARVRIEAQNRAGRLTPGMFAHVDVAIEPEAGLIVPEDAVLDSGRRKTVFVAAGGGRFEPRDVAVGLHAGDRYIVLSGLNEGEQVVTRATFMLDSESQLMSALQSYSSSSSTSSNSKIPKATLTLLTKLSQARVGKTELEVQLVGADGAPVTDSSLEARFYMAPMPAMNMPAMTAATSLEHVGRGVYRGTGSFAMAGSWDVTLSASRQGEQLAEKRLSLVVR